MKFTPSQLKPLLSISIQNKAVPFILGAPGIGKSALIKDIAKDLNAETFVVSANLLSDKSDLTGVMKTTLPDGTVGQSFYPHLTIQEAVNYGNAHSDELVILFLDEVNRAAEDVTTGLMSLSTERRIGNIDLPDNISIVLAGNDSGNVNAVDSATLSRSVLYWMVPDADDLLASPSGQQFAPIIKTWLTKKKSNVFSQPKPDEDENEDVFENESSEDFYQFTTPRTIEKLSEFIKGSSQSGLWNTLVSNYTSGADNQLEEVVYSHIGRTPAATNLIDTLNAHSGSTGNGATFKEVPTFIQDIISQSDVDTIIDEATDAFISDTDAAQRTLTGLLLRNTSANMPDFNMNIQALPGLIDALFEVYPQAFAKAIELVSTENVISGPTAEVMNNSTQPTVTAFNNTLVSLIAGGNVKKETN